MNSHVGYMEDGGGGSLRRGGDLGDPSSFPQGPRRHSGFGLRRDPRCRCRGRAGGANTEEGEGAKFESALLTLPGKVYFGVPWTERW